MSMTAGKSLYRQLCTQEPIPIHSQAWWLDAVCGTSGWDVRVVLDKSGDPVFACPFGLSTRFGQGILRNPPLTTYLNPWIRFPEAQNTVRQYGFANRQIAAWVELLPPAAWHSFLLHPSFQNGMAFHRSGYQLRTRYTYQLQPIQNLEVLWNGVKNTVRTEIRRARDRMEVQASHEVDTFYSILEHSYRANGTPVPLTQDRLQHLVEVLQEKEQGQIYLARDAQGQPFAGALVLMDGPQAYYSLSGSDPARKNAGATNALIWKVLTDLSSSPCESFDFEGSMLPNIEPVFRYFGGQLTPYLHVQKFPNRWMYYLQTLRNY